MAAGLATLMAVPAAAEEARIATAEDALLAHQLFERMELTMMRCDVDTGEAPRFEMAWAEWEARNSYTLHLADVVLAHRGVTYDREATRKMELIGVFGTFSGLGDEVPGFCADWELDIYSGEADLTETHADLFYLLLDSDRAIRDLKR